MGRMDDFNNSVFINCPFDAEYHPILNAIVFAIFDCGFIPRCALEEEDASQIRIEKIYSIIANCKYGIHDISRVEIDSNTGLPRFNMPLELGFFLGAKKFGNDKQHRKKCIILDKEEYRYRNLISDISGQDIRSHNNDPYEVINIVRNWLRTASGRKTIPSGSIIIDRYKKFNEDLPQMCTDCNLVINELIYNDYTWLVSEWLKVQE